MNGKANSRKQYTERLDRVLGYVILCCNIAFHGQVERVNVLSTLEDGEDFDAFELVFMRNIPDGIESRDMETLAKSLNLPNSPGCYGGYTLYAEDSRIRLSLTLKGKK